MAESATRSRYLGLLLAVGAIAMAFAAAPSAARQPAAQQSYIVCYQFNGAPNTDYYSDPFPDTGNLSKITTDFENYVAATYHVGKRIPTCVYYTTEAQARAALTQRVSIAKTKVVETHWKSADPAKPTQVQSPSMPAQPPGPDKAPYNPSPNATMTYAFCWEISADYTVYITPILTLGNVAPTSVNGEFTAFIQKTYGVNQGAACPADRNETAITNARQAQIDELKRSTPKTRTLKFVDVDWKPTPKAAAGAAPGTEVPSAPKPKPLDAYQQALAAQRPNGVAASQAMFCYATGAQQGGGGKAQIYVSKVFSAAPTSQVGLAFQTYLRGAHSGEIISTATCPTAPDADTLQGTRQEYIDSQRKIPTRAIVEVDWKGGQ